MTEKSLLILYGSQMGNAAQLSQTLYRQRQIRGLNASLSSFDSYNILNLPNETLALFIVSTTGQGEPPYNMRKSWNFLLRKDLPSNSLGKLSFSVFGLGDSSYQYFNAMAKKLEKRLLQLGAKSICMKGMGDERNPKRHLAAYSIWIEKIWIALAKIYPLEYTQQQQQEQMLQLKSKVEITESIEQQNLETWKVLPCPPGVESSVMKGKKVSQNLETAKEYSRQTIYVSIELQQGSYCQYIILILVELIQPGDIFAIQPKNSYELCDKLAQRLKLNLNQFANIQGELAKKFPSVIKIKDLFELWLNISKPPSRYFIQLMSYFAKDESQKEQLIKMTSDKKEGIELYHECCIADQINILEILNKFDSVELPFDYFLEGMELILPRQYSICTAHSYETKKIELLMNVVEYETQSKRKMKGLCSNWVANLPIDSEIYYWIKSGNLPFPKQLSHACIMIATGTGIAPFLSHIQFRSRMIMERENTTGEKPLTSYLFFGCRHQNSDFYFQNYLKSQEENSNIEICTAFSRDQEEKVYVTNRISEKADILAKYISGNLNNIKIIVVGTAKFMPQAIEMEFLEIFKLFCNDDIEEAMKLKEKMVENKQYIVEAWS